MAEETHKQDSTDKLGDREGTEQRRDDQFVIDTLWPAHCAPHLLVGGSGTGKTTILFQIIDKWRRGEPWLGYASHPRPYCYVSIDRDFRNTMDTIARVGLDPRSVPVLIRDIELPSFDLKTQDLRTEMLLADIGRTYPESEVLFIDGFNFLVPHGQINNYLIVGQWLQRLGKWCERTKHTIIGATHVPKQKQNDKITDPRQLALGSVAVGAIAGSMLIIESVNDEDRKVTLNTRNAKPRTVLMTTDSKGRLVEAENADKDLAAAFQEKVLEFAPGTVIPAYALLGIGNKMGMSERTIMRKIKDLLKAGVLHKSERRGFYVIPLIVVPGVSQKSTPWEDDPDELETEGGR